MHAATSALRRGRTLERFHSVSAAQAARRNAEGREVAAGELRADPSGTARFATSAGQDASGSTRGRVRGMREVEADGSSSGITVNISAEGE